MTSSKRDVALTAAGALAIAAARRRRRRRALRLRRPVVDHDDRRLAPSARRRAPERLGDGAPLDQRHLPAHATRASSTSR